MKTKKRDNKKAKVRRGGGISGNRVNSGTELLNRHIFSENISFFGNAFFQTLGKFDQKASRKKGVLTAILTLSFLAALSIFAIPSVLANPERRERVK